MVRGFTPSSSATSGTLRNCVRIRAADRSRLPLITHLRSGCNFDNWRVQLTRINACATEHINIVDALALLRRSRMFIALRLLIHLRSVGAPCEELARRLASNLTVIFETEGIEIARRAHDTC